MERLCKIGALLIQALDLGAADSSFRLGRWDEIEAREGGGRGDRDWGVGMRSRHGG